MDRGAETDEHGARHDAVPNVQFGQMRHDEQLAQVFGGQAVPGIDLQSESLP